MKRLTATLVVSVVFSLVASLCIGSTAQAEEIKRDFPKADGLVIKSIQGETHITTSDDGIVHIQLTKLIFSDKCALTFEQAGSTVEIKVEKRGWFSGLNKGDCQLNIEAQVPLLKSVTIAQTSGRIEMKQANVRILDVDAVSATTNIDANINRVVVKSVSGAISVHSPSAKDVFMKSVSGSLELDSESGKPAIELTTVSGDAVMHAAQAPQISFKSVSGHLISRAMTGTGDGAPVNFKSVSGNLTIQ